MDFEIEDSEEESYDLSARKQGNSRQPPSSYNSSTANYNYNPKPAVQPQQQPKRNSGFNDDDNDDDPYNFEYNAENNKAKSKQGGRIAAFSPAAKAGGGGVGNSFADPNNNNTNNALRLSAVSNNDASALDRAKNLLDRYSGKNFKAPESNFKSGRASQHFDEDDISIDEDEDEEEDEDEDENEESRGHHRKLNHDKKNFSVDIEMSDSNADFDPKLISFSKPSTSSTTTTTAAAVSKPPPPTSAPPVHTYPERVINKTSFFFILIYFFLFVRLSLAQTINKLSTTARIIQTIIDPRDSTNPRFTVISMNRFPRKVCETWKNPESKQRKTRKKKKRMKMRKKNMTMKSSTKRLTKMTTTKKKKVERKEEKNWRKALPRLVSLESSVFLS
jgi:hypothetical protein